MDYLLKKEIYSIKKAPMAEMFNLAKAHLKEEDKLINFASGHPSPDIFPNQLIHKYLNEAMQLQNASSILQYGSHIGYMPLREELKNFYNKKGYVIKPNDELLITYGATEAIFLMGLAFINSGDRVIVESPTYVNAIQTFKLLGAEVVAVPMEDDGVSLDALERELKLGAKFFYTVPNFSNPSGVTMSLQKRKAVVEFSKKYNVMILEDDPYKLLRYRRESLPCIKELDEKGKVVYIGSISKIIAPGLRIGFMLAEKELIKKITILKGLNSNGVSNITQYVVWKMFSENNMSEEIKKICDVYYEKLLVMESCMKKYFPNNVKISSPDGGMYLWVTLPNEVDIQKLCNESAIHLHIPLTPGNSFCALEPEKCTSIRFNFVKENLDDIEYGIKRVGKLINSYMIKQ